ncbi:hypothetical protein HOLleu_28759 [Holothuria leucospilota]|uniref:AIG1-type G domain-containing protein n=1 Tax=Holothuria leucospilota TaxID=206669 RepID=A0A9Q1BMI8_HOLLE|nr:hypothetical protein HOLleu_28759 [Holothuria leucospilota]
MGQIGPSAKGIPDAPRKIGASEASPLVCPSVCCSLFLSFFFQLDEYDSACFPFVSETEYEEYLSNGIAVETIKSISKRRSEKAEKLTDEFHQEKFSFINQDDYRKLVGQGFNLTNIEKIEEGRKRKVDELMKRFTLKINRDVKKEDEKTNLVIAVMGLSGEGKRSTAKTILGSLEEEPNGSWKANVGGREISIVHFLSPNEEKENKTVTKKCADLLKGGVHAILFVVNIANHRDLQRHFDTWNKLKVGKLNRFHVKYEENFVKRCILVLTHAETTLTGSMDLDALYDVYIHGNNPFGNLMTEFYPRIVALNNLTDDENFQKRQRDMIISLVPDDSEEKVLLYKKENQQNSLKTAKLVFQRVWKK